MKTGRDLPAVIQQVDQDRQSRKDYLAPTSKLRVVVDDGIKLAGLNGDAYGFTPFAHGQVAQDLAIPKVYYDRMRQAAPGLLAENVNHWLQAEERTRLVRTLRGDTRGWLSDRYRALDNWDLLGAALPTLKSKGCEIVSAEITDTRLYIKAVYPGLQRTVTSKRGDVVQAGVIVRNSEIGDGALAIDPFAYILACLNGAIFEDARFKKHHIGRRASAEAETYQLLTSEAKEAGDKAFWLSVRDIVAGAFDAARFDRLVGRMNEATEQPAVPKGVKVEQFVQDVTAQFALPQSEADEILRHFIDGGDLSTWGLSNAITARSQEVESYEVATQMEKAGGVVIELPRSQWSREEAAA